MLGFRNWFDLCRWERLEYGSVNVGVDGIGIYEIGLVGLVEVVIAIVVVVVNSSSLDNVFILFAGCDFKEFDGLVFWNVFAGS